MKNKIILGMIIGVAGIAFFAPKVNAATINIGTAAELRTLATEVKSGTTHSGDTINLTADIDLGGSSNPWTPIGTSSYPFAGIFDGNGHTISNLYVDQASSYIGLFGKIASSSTISDLSVNGSVSGNEYTGGIIGYSLGTITNVTSYINVTAKSRNYNNAGGIAGYNQGTITNCTNMGAITSGSSVGGIVGYNTAGTIENCTNTGSITSTSTSNQGGRAGGIVGYKTDGTIINCFNIGDVTITNYSKAAGGIVGENGGSGNVIDSKNTGTIVGNKNIGGIIGHTDSSSQIISCVNEGNVSASGENCGGIIGGCDSSSIGGITKCINRGNITTTYYPVGGIVGGMGTGTITLCYNEGAVSGGSYVGGIIGTIFQRTVSGSNLYNSGTITGSSTSGALPSGIISCFRTGSSGSNGTIKYVYNSGNIINTASNSSSKTYGIYAYKESNSTNISDAYYLDTSSANGPGTSKTTSELASDAMVALLNDTQNPVVWSRKSGINNGYPILLLPGVDLISPTGSISIAATYTNGSGKKFTNSNSVQINLTVSDNVTTEENMKMKLINEDDLDLENPLGNITVWDNFASQVTWTLSTGEGQKRVYVIFKDEANNYSIEATN